MMVSTKGRYALRFMLDLARHEGEGSIPLKDSSARTGVSPKYLEAIVSLLSKGDVIVSQRGKDGGYRLSRPSDEITVEEVIELTEGKLAPVSCLEHDANRCERAGECLTLPMWRKLDTLIGDYLGKVTIKDLLEGNI